MKILFFLILLLLPAGIARSQWVQSGDFGDLYVTSTYFVDLPGPPRVGFVGAGSSLYKTTDGGKNWHKKWGGRDYALYFVVNIVFKDSLTGWFTMFGGNDACYRTEDGGETWEEVYSSPYGAEGLYYNSSINKLFLGLSPGASARAAVSDDLGQTWHTVIDTAALGFAFVDGLHGVASSAIEKPKYICGIERTTDGGISWNFVPLTIDSIHMASPSQPLAIPGTSTFFTVTGDEVTVWRSDDYGATWRQLADFGQTQDSNYNTIAPYGTGYIKGDLSHLSVQTDSGIYVSTDEGVHWHFDGGPTYFTNFSNNNFYSAKGVTFAGGNYGVNGGVLHGTGLQTKGWANDEVSSINSSLPFDCFSATGPYSNPSLPNAKNISVLVHVCEAGSIIRAQVYDQLGRPVGQPSLQKSDAQVWDRIPIHAALSSGSYYIIVTVGSNSATLGYSVE